MILLLLEIVILFSFFFFIYILLGVYHCVWSVMRVFWFLFIVWSSIILDMI